ncbi:anthrone oxygenase family protein [Microlunatus flavus]|uniref:Uncharacterized protein n=1 Tax=Microlunatus flavus TaxID=1036181 RepID=A0A1H9NN87_9ACTN|nr:anthrone oxygenase family protein [Microlunatus flavus]SER37362.1 protein of unknown function [Microlunatus flavus]
MTSATRLVEGAHLASTAALTGLVVLDPTRPFRSAPDYAGWLAGQQRVDRVMSRVAPPVFLSTAAGATAAAVVALAQRRPAVAAARAGAAVCVVAAIVVTLRVNEPANQTLRGWRPTDPAPDGWQDVRARWDRAHAVRRGPVACAAVASVAGRTGAWRHG